MSDTLSRFRQRVEEAGSPGHPPSPEESARVPWWAAELGMPVSDVGARDWVGREANAVRFSILSRDATDKLRGGARGLSYGQQQLCLRAYGRDFTGFSFYQWLRLQQTEARYSYPQVPRALGLSWTSRQHFVSLRNRLRRLSKKAEIIGDGSAFDAGEDAITVQKAPS